MNTPDGEFVQTLLNPDEEFKYTTMASKKDLTNILSLDGEYKLCIQLSPALYDALPELKQIRTELYFTNEFRKGNSQLRLTHDC